MGVTPFKNPERTVRSMAAHLRRVDCAFPADRFAKHALRGLDSLELKARAMQICDALQATLPADFGALRAFVGRHPQLVFATLSRWVHDRSGYVRRLVSEGTRPRLPWGMQLKALIARRGPRDRAAGQRPQRGARTVSLAPALTAHARLTCSCSCRRRCSRVRCRSPRW